MGMKLIMLGAPGAGKGTQAEILSAKLGIPTISTGNILRAAIKDGTPIGLQAKSYMDAGKLVPDEVIIGIVAERMEGRRVCSTCGAPYHIHAKPPKQEGICDSCGGVLMQRDDDRPETVRHRLEVYHSETEPLKGYYESKGILNPIPNQPTIEGTTEVIMEALKA